MSRLVPLRTLLDRLAGQMHRMAEMGAEIEDAIGNTIAASQSSASESTALQRIDDLVQSLEGVAAYVERLALQFDQVPLVDPSGSIAVVNQKGLAAALIGCGSGAVETGSADFF